MLQYFVFPLFQIVILDPLLYEVIIHPSWLSELNFKMLLEYTVFDTFKIHLVNAVIIYMLFNIIIGMFYEFLIQFFNEAIK